MYDKLVSRIRFACEIIEGPTADLLTEAADAIEELQQTAEHYKGCSDDWYKEACDYKAMLSRWVSVTERLPEEKKAHYLCYLDDDSIAVCYWSNINIHGIRWEWHNPNWKEVTHWMPLPEPPKEEAK